MKHHLYEAIMKKRALIFVELKTVVWILLLATACREETITREYKLWYDKPAAVWEEALPLGNGRLGAMVFGDPLKEVYQLNEETLWSGGPGEWNNPQAKEVLPDIRQAVNQENYEKAGELWKKYAQGPYTARYLPLANLNLTMQVEGEVTNLYRDLNISQSTATVQFEANAYNTPVPLLSPTPTRY